MTVLRKDFPVAGRHTLEESDTPGRYRLSLSALEELMLSDLSVSFSFDYKKDDIFFANGYQSWTYCPERSVNERFLRAMRFCPPVMDEKYGFSKYGDAHFCSFKDGKGQIHGYSYAYVRRGDRWYLFASLSENTGFTRIILDAARKAVVFEKDCAGRVLRQGERYTVFDLVFLEGNENEVFDKWFEMLGVTPLTDEKAVGYTSWYNCYQNISETRVLADLEGMKALPAKPNIFQIDDGFETFVGDWLDADEKKFPSGMEPIYRNIEEDGYRAGIWLAPFVCEKNSRLFSEHPTWLLKDEKGQPVFCGGNWSGAYALDLANSEVRDYIEKCIRHYKNMGFSLFKLDFLYAACMLARPDKTRGEQMYEAMDFLRSCCGDAAIIGCGVPLAAAFGRVEYCRIGPDVSLTYDDVPYMRFFHAERPSTRHTVLNTLFRRQLSGRAFLNDPDVFILREENTTLTPEQKDLLGTVNGLFGGVLFASDQFSGYTEAQKEQYAQICALADAHVTGIVKEKYQLTLEYELNGEAKKKVFPL